MLRGPTNIGKYQAKHASLMKTVISEWVFPTNTNVLPLRHFDSTSRFKEVEEPLE